MLSKGRKLARRLTFQGMKISIETDKGQDRKWYDPHNGTSGTTTMKYPYGYFRRTTGDDGDAVDVYVGPDMSEDTVYIVRQLKAPEFKEYDEEKVMLGFPSEKEAKAAYLHHYNTPKFFESIRDMSVSDFKEEYVKKSFPQQAPMQLAVPSFNPHDMLDMRAVSSGVNSIGSMSDKDLAAMASAVWGEGYEYIPVSRDQVRSEIRGFLQDQLEWLKQNPAAGMLSSMGQPLPNPEMPHTGNEGVSSIGEDSRSIMSESNLDGIITKDEVV